MQSRVQKRHADQYPARSDKESAQSRIVGTSDKMGHMANVIYSVLMPRPWGLVLVLLGLALIALVAGLVALVIARRQPKAR